MKERKEIYKVLQAIEDIWENTIAWAFFESNTSKTYSWWNVCIDNYTIYRSEDFKTFAHDVHQLYKSTQIRIVFFYCNPTEQRLFELAEGDNLILNIKEDE